GVNLSKEELFDEYDAILLAVGSEQPRDINIEGRDLQGIHFAMEFLSQQNRVIAGKKVSPKERISAKDKHVLVIGGGDTGSDCVGSCNRQQAKAVTQIDIVPKPPAQREATSPWPYWPNTLRTSSAHEEGCERH